jgi:4-amino-4-deoxy-L-arabinose transferase-like glycosyltransferase
MQSTPAAQRHPSLRRDAASTLRPSGSVAAALAIVALAFVSIASRPIMPVDETRYLSVAWEMWHRGSAWVPYLNGEPYDHKPPALFWLIQFGWWIGGAGDAWPRWIGPLSTLVSGALLAWLGQRLWPRHRDVGALAATIFLGGFFVAAYSTLLMFDMPLLVCIATAWSGLWDAAKDGRTHDWALFGAGLGAGLMVKGPVVLVYTLPPLVMIRYWRPDGATPLRWSGVGLAMTVALAPAAGWLSLAASDGGATYLHHLLVDQTLQRVAGDLGHQRPLWWYVPVALLLAVPWLLWRDARRALARLPALRAEPGVRFVAITLVMGFLILCLVHGKQVHYLIPLLALGALLLARGLRELHAAGRRASPLPALSIPLVFLGVALVAMRWTPGEIPRATVIGLLVSPALVLASVLLLTSVDDMLDAARRLSAASAITVLAVVGIFGPVGAPSFDLRAGAAHIAEAQSHNRPVAFVGKYQGEFGFLGRLTKPLTELRPTEALRWASAHPTGLLVVRRKRLALVGDVVVEFRQPYKSDELLMLSSTAILHSGSAFRDAPTSVVHGSRPAGDRAHG